MLRDLALDDRGASVPKAIECCAELRPVGAQVRIVTRDHEMRGKALKAGDRVFIMLNAANRDPAACPDADTLRLDRDGVPHLAFGFGAHICLGFPLARMEGQVAFPALPVSARCA